MKEFGHGFLELQSNQECIVDVDMTEEQFRLEQQKKSLYRYIVSIVDFAVRNILFILFILLNLRFSASSCLRDSVLHLCGNKRVY